MLKLEKISRNDISVTLQDKENFFNRPFLLALSIAILFHLFLAVIFKITPIKLQFTEHVFPPTHVESESFLKDTSVGSSAEETVYIRSGLPDIPESRPSLPMLPNPSHLPHNELIKKHDHINHSFLSVENKKFYQPNFDNLPIKTTDPLSVYISGPLAQLPIISNGIELQSAESHSFPAKHTIRIIYKVTVEQASGKIFWFEPQETRYPKSLRQFVEEALLKYRFARTQDTEMQRDNITSEAFVTSGEMEFHFYD